jgi:excisionase family DNA binding protein
VTTVSPLVVSPKEASRMLNCSHKKIYQLLAEKVLDSFTEGRSRKITVESIQRRVCQKLEASRGEKLKRPA